MKLSRKLLCFSLALALQVPTFAQSASVSGHYLDSYFGIETFGSDVSSSELTSAFEKVASLDGTYTEASSLTAGDALVMAVDAADFEELALTYSVEKATNRLKTVYGVAEILKAEYLPYVVAALDTSLIALDSFDVTALEVPVTTEVATDLVMNVATTRGNARHMLGYSNDADIYNKIYSTWNNVEIIENEVLQAVGNEAVQSGLVTGYNITAKKNDANFLPTLTLRYGHSDIKHAVQLLGLLNSEDIVAKVQLEPKTSAYEYLLEWGPIPPSTPQYEVRQAGEDFYITYAAEYDLVLEFAAMEDKTEFETLVMNYAKKDTSNEEGKALLHGSWWQPLFTSTITMPNYEPIINNVIELDTHRFNTFSLTDVKEQVKTGLDAISEVPADQIGLWVDAPFHRYLLGDFE
ncbi:MAG: hypothetical protein ACRDDX_01435 [Cellulosilyticaceae bacterium]